MMEEMYGRFSDEFKKLEGRKFTLKTDAVTAWAILCQLQLALRHPFNKGPTSEMVKQVAEDIINALAPAGTALREVAEMGWRKEFDVLIEPEGGG